MKYILLGLFLIPTLSFAQRKGYFTISPAFYVTSDATGIGGHLSGNYPISSKMYVGMETGFIKYGGMVGMYVPLQLKLSFLTAKDPSKTAAMFFVQPGYGAYRFGDTRGGFTFYGGVGARFASKGKAHGFINFGYTILGFKVNEVSVPESGLGIKFGLLLQ
jgi:hypothetical protein